MQTLKVREALARLPRARVVFGKINAVLQTTKTFIASFKQTENAPTYKVTIGYRTHELEVERLRAKAEEFAQNLRRKFI
jgi:hypothetical protein